ncbi:MAG: response regulator [Anaerolineales bacterium]|nr:response regulator [Anaerolineales bacterium]MCZ2122412.1 response regulator [Anaerolineales bacterium]
MKTVWIVDDDEEMGSAVSLMLSLLDCATKHYMNAKLGAQALMAAKTPPDLMILDINMPEVTGLDLLEFIRRNPKWQDLPVIMLSSEAADVTVDRAMQIGADGYVMKPVTLEELEKVMAQAFYRHIKR